MPFHACLVVISAAGGASIVDSLLAVRASESNNAANFSKSAALDVARKAVMERIMGCFNSYKACYFPTKFAQLWTVP